MEKMLIDAIYELTQTIQVLALKVDELERTSISLTEHKMDVNNLGIKLNTLIEKLEQQSIVNRI